MADFATRLEDAGSYGQIATWKLATKYELSPFATIRSSIGTDFKTAIIGQLSTVNVITRINSQDNPVAEGIFPTGHFVALYFGAKSLDPERSRFFIAGFIISKPISTYLPPNNDPRNPIPQTSTLIAPIKGQDWNITIDGYVVDLEDRLILSSPFVVDELVVSELVALGIAEANSIAQVIYFTNALETRSMGLETLHNSKLVVVE